MADKKTQIPATMWAQRNDCIFATFKVCECKSPNVTFEAQSVTFTGSDGKLDYSVTIELFDEIDTEKSTWAKEGRGVACTLSKKTECYWPRLFKDKAKRHWLAVDFSKWKDEDDSDDDEAAPKGGMGMGGVGGGDFDLSQMMSQMGNGGMPGEMGMDDIGETDSDDDSDDQDIPQLEKIPTNGEESGEKIEEKSDE